MKSLEAGSSNGSKKFPATHPVILHGYIVENSILILKIFDGQVKASDVPISVSRKWKYEHTKEGEEVKMPTRYACARCATVAYCGRVHQKVDWPQYNNFPHLLRKLPVFLFSASWR
ncbi:hypothetical protein DFH09DRAFT_1275969 [Mycena vulgaris]|nr:hypothetical protein DFH09DRAFT_1275969 [Mycena vulgaris]